LAAHRHRFEVRAFGWSFPKSPAVIRHWWLPPNSAFFDEICEWLVTKYISHWARKVQAAGVGRLYDSLGRGRWSDSSCWLASPILERLQWRFHRRACDRALWRLHLETGHSRRFILKAPTAGVGRTRPFTNRD
jgi:hypothetical protein